jgi:hypothetical protein
VLLTATTKALTAQPTERKCQILERIHVYQQPRSIITDINSSVVRRLDDG